MAKIDGKTRQGEKGHLFSEILSSSPSCLETLTEDDLNLVLQGINNILESDGVCPNDISQSFKICSILVNSSSSSTFSSSLIKDDILFSRLLTVLRKSTETAVLEPGLVFLGAFIFMNPNSALLHLSSMLSLVGDLIQTKFNLITGDSARFLNIPISVLIRRLYVLFPHSTLSHFRKLMTVFNEAVSNFVKQVFSKFIFHPFLLGDEDYEISHQSFENSADLLLCNYTYRISNSDESTDDGRPKCTSCNQNLPQNGDSDGIIVSPSSLNFFSETELLSGGNSQSCLFLERSNNSFLRSNLTSIEERLLSNEQKFNVNNHKLEALNMELEAMSKENARLKKALLEVNTSNSSLKMKHDELLDSFYEAEQSASSFEAQYLRIREELNVEKKRSMNISNENARIKSKLFEYSEIRNKLTRKVDLQAIVEQQLQNLNKELFVMSEVHHQYEERIRKLNRELSNSAGDQLVIASKHRELLDLRKKVRELDLKTKNLQVKYEAKEREVKDNVAVVKELENVHRDKVKILESGLQTRDRELRKLRLDLSDAMMELSQVKAELLVSQSQQPRDSIGETFVESNGQ